MVVNFSESFWVSFDSFTPFQFIFRSECFVCLQIDDHSFLLQNEDIGSYEGFEAVVNRLKAGRTVIKQYAEYLKQR